MSLSEVAKFVKVQKGYGGRVWVEYFNNYAVIRMELGENRMNDLFVDGLNAALDDVERKHRSEAMTYRGGINLTQRSSHEHLLPIPRQCNALDGWFLNTIIDAIKKSELKAVITTGSGKFYSNGLDLEWLGTIAANVPDYIDTFFVKWHNLKRRILTFPILTIAAINGHAFAGGALFSLVHDYRVMTTERGWWCVNEVFLKMRFAPWMIQLLRMNLTVPRAALDAVAYGRRYTAAEAKNFGIAHLTSPGSQLIGTCQTLITQLVTQSDVDRESLTNMKQDLYGDVLRMINETTTDRKQSFVTKPKL